MSENNVGHQTEAPHLHSEELRASQETYEASLEVFTNRLEEQAKDVPEIAERQEALQQAGAELIHDYGLEPELFDDEARSLTFSMIASRKDRIKEIDDEQEYKQELLFVSDATVLLAHKYGAGLREFSELIEDAATPAQKINELAVYEKYTDKELSAELSKAIEAGLLDGVKERMGITQENEDPYDIRVLTVDSGGTNSLGIGAPTLDWDNLPKDWTEQREIINEYDILRQDIQKHQQGLEQRAEDMAADLQTEHLGVAWVTDLGEEAKKTLCVSMPLAEKILHIDEVARASYYGDDELAADKALLEHEYVHTQGGYLMNGETNFGINFEELRAEYFSGDKQGYQDVKGFINDLGLLTRFDAHAVLKASPKGGTAAEMQKAIMTSFDLDTALEVLLAVPNVYAKNGNEFLKAAVERLGHFDGVTQRIIDRQIAAGHGDAVQAAVTEKAKVVLDITNDEPSFILGYRRSHGLNVVTHLTEKETERLLAEKRAVTGR